MKEHFHISLLHLLFQIILFGSMKKAELALDASTDRQTLLSFKSLVSDPHNALSGWNLSSSHCSWLGVTCTKNDTRVFSLSLHGLGLYGNIPHQLSNLTSLRVLDLSNNSFYGEIPMELCQTTQLEHIILSTNSINGTIHAAFSHCYNLETIRLEDNHITGKLPYELGQLRRLKILDMSLNNLSGTIPPTFGNLSSLTSLSLAGNRLSGKVPGNLDRLYNLTNIQLSVNQLSGEIPYSIFNISSLVYLSLTENMLVGKLPPDIGNNLPNLKELYLAHNRIEGFIPSSISNASKIQSLDLSSNIFQGPVPLLGNMNNLVKLHIGLNNLSSTTELNSKVFDSLKNCTKLEILFFNSNKLTGQLPSSMANLSAHLKDLCIDSNYFTGSFPQGLEKYRNLSALSIHRNSFTGEIPSSIGKLQRLQRFRILGNMFSGIIPDVFENLTQLYELRMGNNQFSGRIPTSIAKCQHLSILGLAWNRLNGSIPMEIFRISNLNNLRLEHNALSGLLPTQIGNLKQLEVMDVSDNLLSGSIPSTIDGCLSMRNLSMARNKLTGLIPQSTGRLAALESLDLSSNSLSGPVPEELGNLQVLQSLNLSFNDLDGQVPTKGVFVNISWEYLQGNGKLCGSGQGVSVKLRVPICLTKDDESNSHLVLKIIIPVVSFIMFVCAIICIVLICQKKKKKRRYIDRSSSLPLKGLPQLISYADIQVATDGFGAGNLIGKGAFGSVYKAELKASEDGPYTTVAIKVLDLLQSKACKSFNAECEALRNTRHRNLVKIITSCSSIDHGGAEFKALVMEFMSNGNLDRWLYPEGTESGLCLNLTQRLNIAIDVASAIDYLHHDCNPPIVHCDLKPANVLLDDNMGAHVGDFGLARFLYQNQHQHQNESSTIGLKGSIGYIAPEYGLSGRVSTSGDVYSFGILLLEIFTAKKPTNEMFLEGLNQNKFSLEVQRNQVWRIVDLRLFQDNESLVNSSCTNYSTSSRSNAMSNWKSRSEESVAAIIRIGLSCAAHSAKDRLTMRETLSKLHAIKAFLLDL